MAKENPMGFCGDRYARAEGSADIGICRGESWTGSTWGEAVLSIGDALSIELFSRFRQPSEAGWSGKLGELDYVGG